MSFWFYFLLSFTILFTQWIILYILYICVWLCLVVSDCELRVLPGLIALKKFGVDPAQALEVINASSGRSLQR